MALLPVIASAAYLGPSTVSAAVVSSPARDRAPQPDPLGKAASREVITKPVPPVTTVLVPTALEQLHADLLKIGASNGGRVGISLQELSGPRRTAVSLGARQSFYAASAYKLPLLMAEPQQLASEQGIPAGVPGTVAVVHKVGTLSGSENDSAYVTGGRVTYVLSVAVDGTDEVTGWRTIAQISSRIWRYESSRPAYVVVASAGPSAPLWPDRRH